MKKLISSVAALVLCFCVMTTTVHGRIRYRTAPLASDLEFGQVMLFVPSQLGFTIINHGPTIPANTISVRIIAKKKDNSPAFYYTAPVKEVLPADETTKVVIDLPPDKNLADLIYYILIDSTDRIAESREDNNMSPAQTGQGNSNFPSAPPGNSPFPNLLDLKFRPAVYFTPRDPSAKEKMGTPTINLHIKNNELGSPTNGGYGVMLKVFVMRTNGLGQLVTKVRSTNKTNGSTNSGSAILGDGVQAVTFSIAVVVGFGENKFVFDVDSDNKINEPDENNNKLEVTVIVDTNE